MKGLIITGIIAVFLGVIGIGMYVSYSNNEISKRNQIEAQQEVCKANFDKMFKVIAQTAQVSDRFMNEAKEAFKEIYIPLMEGRYSNERGGSLMSWVTESNPQFDMKATGDLYKQLQRVIEANRQEYFLEQKILIDMHRDHKTYIERIPASFFVGSRESVEITIITSEQTEKTYSTGQENNINLFD